MSKLKLTKKDKKAWLHIFAGICGNLAAGWFGFVLITPGFSPPQRLEDWFVLTKSIVSGIVFMILAYTLERKSR